MVTHRALLDLAKQNQDKDLKIKELEGKIDMLKDELEIESSNHIHEKNLREKFEKDYKDLEQDHHKIKHTVATLRKCLNDEKNLREKFDICLTNLLRKAEAENLFLQEEHKRIIEELKEMSTRIIKEKETEILSLKEEMRCLKEEMHCFKKEIEKLEKDLEDCNTGLKTKIESLKQENNIFEK